MRLFLNLSVGRKLGSVVGLSFLMLGILVFFVQTGAWDVAARQDMLRQRSVLGDHLGEAVLAASQARTAESQLRAAQRPEDLTAASEAGGRAAERLLRELDAAQQATAEPSLREAIAAAVAPARDYGAALTEIAQRRTNILEQRDERFFPRSIDYDRAYEAASGVLEFEVRGEQGADLRARFTAYNVAMGDLRIAVQRYLATDDMQSVQRIRRATSQANVHLRGTLSQIQDQALREQVARVGEASGGLIEASNAIIEINQAIKGLVDERLDPSSTALRSAIRAANQVSDGLIAADQAAVRKAIDAMSMVTLAVGGGIALLLLLSGVLMARTVGAPLRRLAGVIAAIAQGQSGVTVPDRRRADEIGAIANAVEALRGEVERAFSRGQMLEQMPTGVILADPNNDFRIGYMNASVRELLGRLEEHLPVPLAELEGNSIDMLHKDPAHQRAILQDPDKLPYRGRLRIGPEMMDITVSAIRDPQGGYAGAMLAWQVATEKARLADSFEAEIGAVVEAVATSASEMQSAARTLASTAETSGQEAEAVSLASGAASGEVQSVAAAAEEMAQSVSEISRRVAEAAEVATRAVTEVRATDETVRGLSEAAGRIGDVVKLIGDIAGQTNLLALNATIEAARAGDAGKGFAVVAGEVKSLASQTARATEDIASQIQQMQSATARAVSAIRGIGATVERTNEIATAIAAAVEEQGATTTEIARSASQVAAGTDTVAQRIEGVRHGAQETGRAAGSLLGASDGLAGQATLLREKAAHFLTAVRAA
ncbi:MAG TPA: methyl-accepting chemotaxis protein [Roseomonas sp.]|jgi:methyl-accepting chemotaxis protein